MRYFAVHLTAAELSILEEATTAALEQLGRSSVSDPHAFADAAISSDLMDKLLDQIYDTTDETGPDEAQAILVLTAELRDVARALLTAASSALAERSSAAQDEGRIDEAALLLAQTALARSVELRLLVAALVREDE